MPNAGVTSPNSVRRAGAGLSVVYARLRRTADVRRRMRQATDALPLILRETAAATGSPEASDWSLQAIHPSGTQVVVMHVGLPGRPPAAVVKVPATADGIASQQREAEALAALRAEPSLGGFAALVPDRLANGEVGGLAYAVERAIRGVEGRALLDDPTTKGRLVEAAAGVARQLHRATAHRAVVDDELLQPWVSDRIRLITPATRNTAALHRLELLLRRGWESREVAVSWVHGDFWPANVIFDREPSNGDLRVSGVLDWEWAAARELPAQDLLYLLMQMRMLGDGRELGPVVAGLLNGDPLTGAEHELLEPSGVSADPETVLAVWLRHVAYNLIQSPGDARNWVWTRRNVETVLRLV